MALVAIGVHVRAADDDALHQCVKFISPDGGIAFDESVVTEPAAPQCWEKLSQQFPSIIPAWPVPPVESRSSPPISAGRYTGFAAVFLHGLVNSNGAQRLVCVMAAHQPRGMALRPIVLDYSGAAPVICGDSNVSKSTTTPMRR